MSTEIEVVCVDDVKNLRGKDSVKNEFLALITTGKLRTYIVQGDTLS